MGNLRVTDKILGLIDRLPETRAVLGYGSGVIDQGPASIRETTARSSEDPKDIKKEVKKAKKDIKQIDMIIVVDNLKEFYKKNIKMNSHMYRLVPKMFFKLASDESLKKGVPICYTAYVNDGDDTYKMGVIEKNDVLDDLLNWKSYYLAGRFQKEMYTAKGDPDIERANEINKRNALTLGLLLVDYERPTLTDLYENICSLSFMGDVRGKFGAEDPNKIKNLVAGSRDFLNREYRDKTNLFTVGEDGMLDIDYISLIAEVDNLPEDISEKLKDKMLDNREKGKYELDVRDTIEGHLSGIINKTSTEQAIKGIWTTGPIKSLEYAVAKLKKGHQK